jgi:hypothetical protein
MNQIRASRGTSKFFITNDLELILNDSRCKESHLDQVSYNSESILNKLKMNSVAIIFL